MVKLIALDLDGTLLNSKNQVSPRTLEMLKVAQKKGIEVMACTGRTYDGVTVNLSNEMKCSSICLSGAAVYDEEGNETDTIAMEYRKAKEVLEFLQAERIYCDILTNDGMYTTASLEESYRMYEEVLFAYHIDAECATKEQIQKMVDNVTHVKSCEEMEEKNIIIYKIVGIDLEEGLIERLKEQLCEDEELAVASSSPINVEITSKEANKGIALKRYAERKKIAMGEVMAIGDSENDISMLSMDFGYTVAMGNAHDKIKNIAKYVTKSNDEDGVAWAVEQFI